MSTQDKMNSSPSEKINELLDPSSLNASVEQGILDLAKKVILDSVSQKYLDRFLYFRRVIEKNEKPFFEISILTSDLVIHDISVSIDKSIIFYFIFTPDTCVDLKTFYSKPTENILSNEIGLPYRAELVIGNGLRSVEYSAEGDRRLVNALVNYGNACAKALHSSILRR